MRRVPSGKLEVWKLPRLDGGLIGAHAAVLQLGRLRHHTRYEAGGIACLLASAQRAMRSPRGSVRGFWCMTIGPFLSASLLLASSPSVVPSHAGGIAAFSRDDVQRWDTVMMANAPHDPDNPPAGNRPGLPAAQAPGALPVVPALLRAGAEAAEERCMAALLLDVCPRCGEYAVDTVIEPGGPVTV